jgi:hypothetical protein
LLRWKQGERMNVFEDFDFDVEEHVFGIYALYVFSINKINLGLGLFQIQGIINNEYVH